MKHRVTALTLVCISLIGIFVLQSFAKIDSQNIVGMWLFDKGTGEVAKDYSDNGNDGKLINGPKWVQGKFGKALEFDGEDGYVDVGDLGLSGAITISIWAKPNNAVDDDRLISNTIGPTGPAFTIRFQGGGVEVWSQKWQQVISSFDNNQWGHYAFVFDGSGNSTGFYNGVEGSTVSDPPYAFTNIGIGANFLDNWGQYFDGLIDEVAIFNVALTEDDIKSVMTKGLKSIAAVSTTGKLAGVWGNMKTQ